jgi:hypothetical protein
MLALSPYSHYFLNRIHGIGRAYFSECFLPSLLKYLFIACIVLPKDTMLGLGQGLLQSHPTSLAFTLFIFFIQSHGTKQLYRFNPRIAEYESSLPIPPILEGVLVLFSAFLIMLPLFSVLAYFVNQASNLNHSTANSALKTILCLVNLAMCIAGLEYQVSNRISIGNTHFLNLLYRLTHSVTVKFAISKLTAIITTYRKKIHIEFVFIFSWLAILFPAIHAPRSEFPLYYSCIMIVLSVPLLTLSRYAILLNEHDSSLHFYLDSLPLRSNVLKTFNIALTLLIAIPILVLAAIGQEPALMIGICLLNILSFIVFRMKWPKWYFTAAVILITTQAILLYQYSPIYRGK